LEQFINCLTSLFLNVHALSDHGYVNLLLRRLLLNIQGLLNDAWNARHGIEPPFDGICGCTGRVRPLKRSDAMLTGKLR
jgi:hypothetical protein